MMSSSSFWLNTHVTSPKDLPLGSYYDSLVTTSAPLSMAFVYLVVVNLWMRYNRVNSVKPAKGGALLRGFVLAHNLVLMVFSLLTFLHTGHTVFTMQTQENTLKEKFCDVQTKYWSGSLFYWTWLFYLSKIYELVDTVIILVKGRSPSFLQSYHHAGAIIGMWFLVSRQTQGSWIFVTLNSFIHTIMYSYYILATLGYNLTSKKYITYMQIAQFFLGCAITSFYYIIPNCVTPPQKISIAFNLAYVTPLIFLFIHFARQNYSKKTKSE